MKKSFLIIGILLLCCLFVGGVSASAEGGLHDGTYLIYDSADLVAFASYINGDVTHVSTNAKLMADIDLSSVSSWTPIGTSSNQYVGTFDGNGHTISGLSDKLIYGWSSIVCNTKFKDISIISPRLTSHGNYYFIQQSGPNSQIKNCEFNNCNIYYNYDDSSLGIGIVICLAKQINNCCFINCHLECTGNVNNCGAHLCQASYTSNIYAFGCELDASSSGGTHSIAYAPSLVGRYPGYQIQLIDMSNLAVLSTTCSISTSTSSYSYVKGYIGGSFTTESLQSQSSLYIDNTIARSTGGTLNVYTNQEIQMPLSTMQQQSFWTTSSNWYGDGWDFTNTWYWDSTANLPKLRVFLHPPTVSEITINADKGAINTQYSPQITPTISNLGGASTVYYKVQVSTDGTTYTDASSVSSTTTTGQKSAITATSFTDTTARTHYYRVIATSLNGVWTSDKAGTSTTVTFTTYAPPSTPTANNPDPNQIGTGVATSISLSATSVPTAPTGLTYTYQWYYASSTTPSAGDTAIGTAQTTYQDSTWSISSSTFTSPTTKYLYLKITDSLSQTTYSNRVELQVMDLSATANWASSLHGLEDTIRLAVIGNQPLMTYQWYYKTTGEYATISGATTWNYQTTANALRVSSGTAIKFKCVVTYMGSTYNLETGTLTPYASPVVNAPTASSIKFAVPGTTTLTAHVVDSSLVSSYQWQIYQSSAWTNIASATASTYTASISTAGVYQYRVSVLGINGHSVESTAISITTGAAPTVTITSPTQGQTLEQKGQVNLTATATGVGNTYAWNIGDSSLQHGDLTSLNSWVKYKLNGAKTVSITATNEYGSATSTVSFTYRDPSKRDMASATLSPVPTSAVSNLTSVVDVTPGTYPSIKATVQAVMAPIEEVMPTGFVFVIVFGVIFLMLWLITKNTAVPAIIGVIFGGFLLALFPASYYGPALIILAISIAGGMYRVFRPPQ